MRRPSGGPAPGDSWGAPPDHWPPAAQPASQAYSSTASPWGSVRRAMTRAGEEAGHLMARVEQQVAQADWQKVGLPAGCGPAICAGAADPPRHGTGPPPDMEVRVCSWNLHGSSLDPRDHLDDWLLPSGRAAHLYVIGIQELVDLNAKTVLTKTGGDQERQAALESRIWTVLRRVPGADFVKVCGFGMVGLTLLVYVQGSLRPYLGGVDCDRVKTGMDGMSGNKGCVCVRMLLGSLSLCFINVHLASGQTACAERSEHLWQILSDAFQGTSIRGRGKLRAPKMGFLRQSRYFACDHGLLVLFGDMNIRLELLPEEQRPPGGPEAWLDRDQLSLGKLPSLRGFREGDIRFAPTFKYVPGSSTFSDKRCPAWTDRVVFKAASGVDVELLEYDSFPQMMHTSDHHAIAAQFFVAGAGSAGAPPAAPAPPAAAPQRLSLWLAEGEAASLGEAVRALDAEPRPATPPREAQRQSPAAGLPGCAEGPQRAAAPASPREAPAAAAAPAPDGCGSGPASPAPLAAVGAPALAAPDTGGPSGWPQLPRATE